MFSEAYFNKCELKLVQLEWIKLTSVIVMDSYLFDENWSKHIITFLVFL